MERDAINVLVEAYAREAQFGFLEHSGSIELRSGRSTRHLSQEVVAVPAYTRAFTALRELPNGFNHLVQEPLKASVVIGTLVPDYLNF